MTTMDAWRSELITERIRDLCEAKLKAFSDGKPLVSLFYGAPDCVNRLIDRAIHVLEDGKLDVADAMCAAAEQEIIVHGQLFRASLPSLPPLQPPTGPSPITLDDREQRYLDQVRAGLASGDVLDRFDAQLAQALRRYSGPAITGPAFWAEVDKVLFAVGEGWARQVSGPVAVSSDAARENDPLSDVAPDGWQP